MLVVSLRYFPQGTEEDHGAHPLKHGLKLVPFTALVASFGFLRASFFELVNKCRCYIP
jgi:hypothetical protein